MRFKKPKPISADIEFCQGLEHTTEQVFQLLSGKPALVCLGACICALIPSAQAQGIPLEEVREILTETWKRIDARHPELKPN